MVNQRRDAAVWVQREVRRRFLFSGEEVEVVRCVGEVERVEEVCDFPVWWEVTVRLGALDTSVGVGGVGQG